MPTTSPPGGPPLADSPPDHRPVALRAAGVSCRRGGRLALDSLGVAFEVGSVTAIVGHNGSGKSTALAVLAGMVRPWRGKVSIPGGGSPATDRGARLAIGYLPQRTPAFGELSVTGQLQHAARLRGQPSGAAAEALSAWGLASVAGRTAARLSPGELRRLGMALATLGRPSVLLLDEPHAGLDPPGRQRLDQWLQAARGTATVVHATHEPDAALALSDRLLVLRDGRLVHDAAAGDGGTAIRIRVGAGAAIPPGLVTASVAAAPDPREGWIVTPRAATGVPAIIAELVQRGVPIERVIPDREDRVARLHRLMSAGS